MTHYRVLKQHHHPQPHPKPGKGRKQRPHKYTNPTTKPQTPTSQQQKPGWLSCHPGYTIGSLPLRRFSCLAAALAMCHTANHRLLVPSPRRKYAGYSRMRRLLLLCDARLLCTKEQGRIRLQKERNASMWLSVKLGTGWNALLVPYTDGLGEVRQDM